MNSALHYCWMKLQLEVARLITEHPTFKMVDKQRIVSYFQKEISRNRNRHGGQHNMIQYYPPTVDDPLARAEFIAFFCALMEVEPSDLVGENDPALQLIFSRKKSAYK